MLTPKQIAYEVTKALDSKKGMEGFGVFSGKIIQHFTIGLTQSQLQGAVQGLGDVVEQSGPAGIHLVCPPALGQLHRRIPAAQHMAHPVGVQEPHHHLLKLLHGKILEIRPGIVEPFPADIVQDFGT